MSRRALYAHTVFCKIYQLRRDGTRIPWIEAELTMRHGWLKVMRELPLSGMPCFHATLDRVAAGGELAPLHDPKLYRVDEHGLFIKGYETGPRHQAVRQTWLVVPCAPPPNSESWARPKPSTMGNRI